MNPSEPIVDERFTPDGKHKHDPKRQRATFGVEYPSLDRTFKDKRDIPRSQEKVLGHRLTFSLERQTFTEVEFEECNFHNKHGLGFARLGYLTFDRCRFRRSFMGTAKYEGCRFRHCTFTRCDFSFALFSECTFEECEFVECTAGEAAFERTEIDANAFMVGLDVPLYNYGQGLANNERAQLAAQIDDVRFRIASRLVRSSIEVSHRFYVDAALRYLRWEELRYRRNRLKGSDWLSTLGRLVGFLWAHLVYQATAGGTSLLRPVALLLLLALATSLVIPVDCVSYNDVLMNSNDFASRFLASLTLVLGIGFTSFDWCQTLSFGILVSTTSVGLVILALLASVIVRRVYR